MADWSNLCHDLLKKISGSFLETEDLDYYMDFRAVCREWRRATIEPTLDGTDPRFKASKWMMLKRKDDGGFLTFVNLATGRFPRKRLPCLRGCFFVGAATGSGLLVVEERAPPQQTRVINPFTGVRVCFRAPIPVEKVRAVVVVTSSPMMVFVSGMSGYMVSWIDQSSDSFERAEFTPRGPQWFWYINSHMTLFDGGVHLNAESGSIISSRTTDSAIAVVGEEGAQQVVLEQQRSARTITVGIFIASPAGLVDDAYHYRYYLVESEGELLLVRTGHYFTGPVMVYKVDKANKVLVPVKSIGGRAIFVSNFRCFSVDASKFHTVQTGSIYCAFYNRVLRGPHQKLSACMSPLLLPSFRPP